MPLDLAHKNWLDTLLVEELRRYDPDAARSRLPADVRTAASSRTDLAPAARILVARSLRRRRLDAPTERDEEFVDGVRVLIGLALDLALLRREPFVRANQRAEIAAFLAAALGEPEVAIAVEPEEPGGGTDRAVERALRVAGQQLLARFDPPGDPVLGLALYPGSAAVVRRHLARVAMGFHRTGRLDPDALDRHRTYAVTETVLLAEAIAGLSAAEGGPDARARTVRQRQLGRLGLPRAEAREARDAITAPRAPELLAAAAPEPVRPFLLEQLLLAQLQAKLVGPGPARFVEAFVAAGKLDAQTLVTAQVEAAAQHGDHQAWFEVLGDGGVPQWQALADEWEAVADHVVERVSSAVTENLDAIVTEIRETGELTQLLAKAAAGTALDAAEKKKVKRQLIDLAKTVPALAIFAAPGGMLLLPLLAKLLPFSVLPSAWDRERGADPASDAAPGRSTAKGRRGTKPSTPR